MVNSGAKVLELETEGSAGSCYQRSWHYREPLLTDLWQEGQCYCGGFFFYRKKIECYASFGKSSRHYWRTSTTYRRLATLCQRFTVELVVVAAGNPSRLIDGINTIGMLLTSAKVNTEAGYPGVSIEDEGRDPNFISLACLGTRQRFRYGGVLDCIF
eukprot:Gb_34872 [translate_table: standard]